MSHYVAHLVPEGTACRYIVMMSVAPAYQGLGVGSALLKWGTEKADADGVFCWVSSSMGGYLVFEKAGFVEVGRQALVLDHYAQGVKTAEGGEWGVYVWRWMRRDPIPA
jgi:GNAT superfamily N-acetyltransferase